MSQPQLTKFFSNTKRSSRAAGKAGKQLDSTEPPAPRKSTRAARQETKEPEKVLELVKVNKQQVEKVAVKDAATEVKEDAVVRKPDKENKEDEKEAPQCPSPVKRTRRTPAPAPAPAPARKRGGARGVPAEEVSACPPSPSKKARTGRSAAVEEAIAAAVEIREKLTPQEVKAKLTGLKGRNKLAVLKEQLKTIQEAAKTKEAAEAEARAREEAEAARVKTEAERAERRATPAYQKFHSLKEKAGADLALPYTYKFLEEVFRATETIGAMLHNRQEIITVEKLRKGVQQQLRKNFSVDYLKQIKTIFPAAYKYAWEQMIGRYGKKLNDYELHVKVNLNYQRETQELLGGDPADLAVVTSGKLAPTAVLERRNILHNSLVNLVREHNAAHCARLGLQVDNERVTKVHPSFDLDSCPAVPATELPAKPELREYMSAKAMLEQARDLFEAAPRVAAVLEEVAGKVEEGKEEEKQPVVAVVEPKAVPKALASVPMSLLERIRAKEAEKKAREMYQDKGEEIRMKRLKRLPDIARIVKSIFVSEGRNALKRPFLVQKLYQSYPGYTEKDVLAIDLDKLAELTAPWIVVHKIQGDVWLKMEKETDVNQVVKVLEKAGDK